MCVNDRKRENPEIDPANNRIKELQPDGDSNKDYEFDAAGNTIKDPVGREFFYDGENKQIKVEDISDNTIGQYWYDGDGKRVKKYVPSTGETTIFHYDAAGKLIAEYSTIVETSNPQVSYLTNDHLGSPRITTDKNGNVFSRRDFLPFGEELNASHTSQRNSGVGYTGDSVRQKFTGYERDYETDLDFAQSRTYQYIAGRYTSPDSFSNATRVVDPQSWNLFVYVRNNPQNTIDPLGKKGRIRWETDPNTGNITVSLEAKFAIYAAKGSNISSKDLEKYKNLLVAGIKKHLEKEFKNIGGKDISVVTGGVSAVVVESEAAATQVEGVDNIVEIGNGEIDYKEKSDTDYETVGLGFGVEGENFDRMVVSTGEQIGGFPTRTDGDLMNTFAHEFGSHLLGVGLHNTNELETDSLFSGNGGKGIFMESDLKSLLGPQIYNPPPPLAGITYPSTGGLVERKAASRNNESPSSVYSWKRRVRK